MAYNTAMRAALALALAGVALAPAVPAWAQGVHAGQIDVPVNKSQVITADRPIAKAMVGNAEIADVLPVTDQSIYVLG